MANEALRAWILDRFKSKTAKKNGGITASAIRGGSYGCQVHGDLEGEIKAMRDEGILAFTGGLWWLRNK